MNDIRVGLGYDSHRVDASRPLMLGGICIPDAPGLKGHSDADVLIHAIIDALLGAAALGDIGSHFPDTDEKWKGADSSVLLAAVVKEIRGAGWQIGNVDATVICEQPKLRPWIELICNRLAEVMGVGSGRISVKGKTNEKMDDVGAGVGIAVQAIALLER